MRYCRSCRDTLGHSIPLTMALQEAYADHHCMACGKAIGPPPRNTYSARTKALLENLSSGATIANLWAGCLYIAVISVVLFVFTGNDWWLQPAAGFGVMFGVSAAALSVLAPRDKVRRRSRRWR